jgi:hypothetical protein
MAQSVRLSCNMDQNPSLASNSAFVLASATRIIVSNGMAASLVSNPDNISAPQIISKLPTKGPRKSGLGKPIFANRPVPSFSANKNFCMPSERKTAPTIRRMIMVVLASSVFIIFLNISEIDNNYQKVVAGPMLTMSRKIQIWQQYGSLIYKGRCRCRNNSLTVNRKVVKKGC